jgi:hypothetical protein
MTRTDNVIADIGRPGCIRCGERTKQEGGGVVYGPGDEPGMYWCWCPACHLLQWIPETLLLESERSLPELAA